MDSYLYFQKGETFLTPSGQFVCPAVISGSRKLICLTYYAPKRFDKVSNVQITTLLTDFRTSDGTYTPNSVSGSYDLLNDSHTTISLYSKHGNELTLKIDRDEVYPNVTTNNTPIAGVVKRIGFTCL